MCLFDDGVARVIDGCVFGGGLPFLLDGASALDQRADEDFGV